MNEDGLLSAVSDEDAAWLRPNFGDLPTEGIVEASIRWISDVLEAQQVVWPAAFEGRLAVPPAAHVLDSLTRRHLIFGDEPSWDAEWQMRPVAGTIALMDSLPDCDVCRRPASARYDAPASRRLPAPWANLCPWCYQRRSTTQLGTGHGQFLLRYAEIPPEVWDAAARARLVWAARGAPVSSEELARTGRINPPDPLPWPYRSPFPTEKSRRQRLLEDVLLSAVVELDEARGLFSDVMSWEDNAVSYYTAPHPVDGISQLVRFGEEGTRSLDALVYDLSEARDVRRRADHAEVRHLVIQQVAKILVEGASPGKVLSRFEAKVGQLVGPLVWIAPLGGISWSGPPTQIGDAFVVGRLGPELHAAIDGLAEMHGLGARIKFDYASDWAEDYESFLEDPDAFGEWEAEAWRPVVIAQVVDAVGSVAHHLGFQKAHSLAGAIWAAAPGGRRSKTGSLPWVLGTPGHPNGRPDEEDGPTDLGTTTLYTLRGGSSSYEYFHFVAHAPIDVTAMLTDPGGVAGVVALWSPSDVSDQSPVTRLAASARHARAGLESQDLYFSAFHLVAALETLLIDREDAIGKHLARRVAAVLGRRSARAELKQLYDLRSKAAHRGLSARPLADAVQLVDAGWTRLPEVMRWVAERADGMPSMRDLVAAVDALPEPTDD